MSNYGPFTDRDREVAREALARELDNYERLGRPMSADYILRAIVVKRHEERREEPLPHVRLGKDFFSCVRCATAWSQRGIDDDWPAWGWLVCPACNHDAPRPI
jgi:hypothetical protein